MNSSLPLKCLPYISNSKRNTICGISYMTRRFKSDDSPTDDDNSKNQSAVDKLNKLLKTMKKGNDSDATTKISKRIDLAQPRQLARKVEKSQQKMNEAKQNKPLGEKLADAANSVAQTIGGDIKKTESELLNLLKIYKSETNDSSEKKPRSSVHLNDLLSGMKIDRSPPKSVDPNNADIDKAQRVRKLIGQNYSDSGVNRKVRSFKNPMSNYIPINLFSSEPLDIFKNMNVNQNLTTLSTWDKLYEKSLQLAVTHPPKNIYDQMIIWTEQGKLWNFPINNEQGMDDESNVFFAEHVFLEPLIDEWCPKKGPVRHFMELVCVGLSKNPFLSVEEKKDHINWFRQYFYEKNQLLKEVGAFEILSLPENAKEYYKPSIPDE